MHSLRWLILFLASALFFAGLATAYGQKVHGVSLVAAPVILCVYAYASWVGLRGARKLDAGMIDMNSVRTLEHWSHICQMLGITATVFGAWRLLNSGPATASGLYQRINDDLGVALVGTFVGVVCSIFLTQMAKNLER
jgi:hypothetical protein